MRGQAAQAIHHRLPRARRRYNFASAGINGAPALRSAGPFRHAARVADVGDDAGGRVARAMTAPISRRDALRACSASGALLLPGIARAADFYQGKTLTMIVGFAPGGGVDTT